MNDFSSEPWQFSMTTLYSPSSVVLTLVMASMIMLLLSPSLTSLYLPPSWQTVEPCNVMMVTNVGLQAANYLIAKTSNI